MTTSGTTLFGPSIADMIIECYSRIQIRGPALTPEHTIEARRSTNLIFSDWSGSRSGPPLWAVDQIAVPLLPGVGNYTLPRDTVMLLDVYRRQLQPATPVAILLTADAILSPLASNNGIPLTVDNTGGDLGNVLIPMLTGGGIAMTTGTYEPMVLGPGSGTLSSTAGSLIMTLVWPNHGLSVGDPIFFADLVSIGNIVLQGFVLVSSIIDSNTVSFLSTVPALTTQALMGATPLLQTFIGSPTVTVTLPNHLFSAGATFTIPIATTVGGITLYGDYTITSIMNTGQFTITAASVPTSTTATFSNSGLIRVATQDATASMTDMIMTSISRTDYSSFSDKRSVGIPTVFWLDRTIVPSLTVWQVPPYPQPYYALIAYRWRQIQDADPINGQTADIPNRWLGAFAAELTARLAEKFQPAVWKDKAIIAEGAWRLAEQGDFENVPLYITPGLSSYFR